MDVAHAELLLATLSAPGAIAPAVANPVDRKQLRNFLDTTERQIKHTRRTIDQSRGKYSTASTEEAHASLDLLLSAPAPSSMRGPTNTAFP